MIWKLSSMRCKEDKFPCSIKTTAAKGLQKPELSTRLLKKHLVNKEFWELPFIIERSKGANVDIYL